MTTAENFLDTHCNFFSDRLHNAAQHGGLNAKPLLHLLEDARCVSLGVAAILQMERNNDVQTYCHINQPVEETARLPVDAPLSPTMMGNLLELARVSSQMISNRIEHLAEWAEEDHARRTETTESEKI